MTSKKVNVKFMIFSFFADIFKTIKGQRSCGISNDSLQCCPGNRYISAGALFGTKWSKMIPRECPYFGTKVDIVTAQYKNADKTESKRQIFFKEPTYRIAK